MATPRVLLLIPPLTQLNTPYPSTAYLTGFLQSRDIVSEQADLGIEMVLRLFSPAGLRQVFGLVRKQRGALPQEATDMLAAQRDYLRTISLVIEFLQGQRPDVASHLIEPGVLPQGPRFKGKTRFPRQMSMEDRAKHWATLYLEDLADLVQATIAPSFALSRYAEHLAHSASSFDRLNEALAEPPSLPDTYMIEALLLHLDRVRPDLVGLTVPFPGNLYGAFRLAQAVKRWNPNVAVALGGGYANTELRRVSDPRVFDYVDFITLDDGERPLLSLIEHLSGQRPLTALCRTFYREHSRVLFADNPGSRNFSMNDVGCPTYRGLKLDQYLTILDSTNPMHRLWSEAHWNKLTVAHGCYWKQCTFCDVGLDYIGRYEMTPTERLIQQIEQLISETGHRGFHFVDEAAPPSALKALALRMLERDIRIRWWGNIRFEQAFTPDLCRLLAASGCIAVTAGLETASDRLLDTMKKGITVDQTALVAAAFQQAGILIHAYLMYGFPSETVQETVDSLERVRQLFLNDLIQSAFWHRFTATAHSPIGLAPKAHGLRILGPAFQGFADNDLIHLDHVGVTPPWIGEGLRRSMLNFLEQRGLSMDVRLWFDQDVPRPNVPRGWVRSVLRTSPTEDHVGKERRLVWLGDIPAVSSHRKLTRLSFDGQSITLPSSTSEWLSDLLASARPTPTRNGHYPRMHDLQASFPGTRQEFDKLLGSRSWKSLRRAGLLLA
ncbi:MAG: radical SAM protein [Nitrospira sp.]